MQLTEIGEFCGQNAMCCHLSQLRLGANIIWLKWRNFLCDFFAHGTFVSEWCKTNNRICYTKIPALPPFTFTNSLIYYIIIYFV